jgi:hypothetical protein
MKEEQNRTFLAFCQRPVCPPQGLANSRSWRCQRTPGKRSGPRSPGFIEGPKDVVFYFYVEKKKKGTHENANDISDLCLKC